MTTTNIHDDVAKIKAAINKGVRTILENPCGQLCKHWTIAALLSELEAAGFPQPDGFIKAVVHADDATALAYPDIFDENHQPNIIGAAPTPT